MSKPMQFFAIKDMEHLLFQSFTFVLLSSLALPLFPFWDIVIILLSLAFLANAYKNKIIRSAFCFAFVFSVCLFVKYIFSFGSFFSFLYSTFFNFDLFGLTYQKEISINLLIIQLFILGGLIQINYIKYKKNKFHLLSIIGISLFAFFTNVSSFINASFSGQINLNCLIIPAMYFSIYLNNQKNIQFFLKYIVFVGVLVACLILFQMLIQDYSYSAAGVSRVKATYYYHSSASLCLALSFFFILQYKKLEQFNLIDWVSIVLLLLALYLNSTRAIALSLIIAAICMLAYRFLLKNYRDCLFLLIVAILFSGSIFYEKIDNAPHALNEPTLSEVNTKKDLKESVSMKIVSYVRNNFYRISLIDDALKYKANLLTGLGIGKTLSVVKLNGRKPLKQRKSTHSLIVDILVLTGIFSLISFLSIFLTPLFYKTNENVLKTLKINYLGSIVFIFCVSFFFPKEQNYLVMLFFIIPLLYTSMSETKYQFKENECKKGSFDIFKTFAIFASTACIFLFSPRYILPAIEFHFSNFVSDTHKYEHPIFTNSLPFKYILEASFKLIKGKYVEIHMLEDDFNKMPNKNAFVFWDPVKEDNYPILLSTIGQTEGSEYGFWDTLKRPNHWQSIRLYLTVLTLFKIQPQLSAEENIKNLGI